ncbi:5-methylcytosine-specific restriction endonuclease system specificity protein McrC [Candidatus Lucifugimonas marina]|uniref:5-methylcytosine-specific restriction endonuclease system specificity protein McrC n=1 Tax=Candidatus Lucifugimonas marina TaxID=3038979 RepID=A0AAJ5ZGT8_9CHLR|nr:5-methylcytosine-specific restriction endonuclease system specificity protein McrC [SAR202 cluster bacterium JH702]MDG0870579.1 5-methylcytosine-specific restriction endonuclease system specificity protein McrC [SAR202 cluster bacterium JH639]WFG35880.1 5-methylcytosine-specific restriction endonuclease system specificity protein McrC [SAR202 cluster bacterium JH545]WFG39824.1 5-methylcytosine-specific restriction endonuclease system specificity protein McrC [SAR202 cluster bacterium JH1073]
MTPPPINYVGRIPVRNLWLLMLYASDSFKHLGDKNVEVEENPENIPDLVAELLADAVEHRIRRNLTFGYRQRNETLSRVRGRIDHLQTARRQLMSKGQIACVFEDFTIDTPRNRMVCAALTSAARIVRSTAISRRCNSLANRLISMGVSSRTTSRHDLQLNQFGRNDRADRQMVELAKLIFDLRLPTEEAGPTKLFAPDREEHWIRSLFEKAVLGFYKLKLISDSWKVSGGTRLYWQIEDASSGIEDILPGMITDIVLDLPNNQGRIIIDTKFTSVVTSGRFRSQSLKSGHIYQIYAYLNSQNGNGHPLAEVASGLMLHPSIDEEDEEIDEWVTIQNHKIRFATVDLTQDPSSISTQLLKIIDAQ